MSVYTPDWDTLPVPADDCVALHLIGTKLSAAPLPATDGRVVDLSNLAGRSVIYTYPRTGQPGSANPDGWDGIPGARGCAPQSCAFRDHAAALRQCGVRHLFGLSTQDTAYQAEAATRLHLPFALLSDSHLLLTSAAHPRGGRHDAAATPDPDH